MSKLNDVRKHLRPGQVYRRAELTQWSNAVDRHLKQLQKEGTLTKLAGGLYYCPKNTAFGEAPPDEDNLVETFLKDRRFLLTTPNAYNTLGLGTTQLYNTTVVYNHKRHGRFSLGGRVFEFRMKSRFPQSLTEEFLLVDLVNNLGQLAENRTRLLRRAEEKALSMDRRALVRVVRDYGGVRAKKFFAKVLGDATLRYAA